MRSLPAIAVFLIIIQGLCNARDVMVLCAMGAKEAVEEVAKRYERDTGNRVLVVASSSGRLAKQIEEGAPWDLFISASTFWTSYLMKRGVIAKAFPLLTTRLVLVTYPSSKVKSAKDICGKRVAIGDYRFAPFGRYALEALRSTGLYDCVKEGIILASHTHQAIMWVTTGNADAAVVYMSDYLRFRDRLRLIYLFPEKAHSRILFTAAYNSPEGKGVLEHIKKAKDVFRRYGFELLTP